jgi:hypothetical protein
MIRLRRKIAVTLLLGWYLAVVSASGAFHTHAGDPCCAPRATATDCCHESTCHADEAVPTKDSEDTLAKSRIVLVDPDCPVCSFLAQKPIAGTVVENQTVTDLNRPLLRVRAIPPIDETPATIFLRGPPAVA